MLSRCSLFRAEVWAECVGKMLNQWERVEEIDGYDRTYRKESLRVAYKSRRPGAAYLDRDLFVDGNPDAIPLPPVYVEPAEPLNEEFYKRGLGSVTWLVPRRRHGA